MDFLRFGYTTRFRPWAGSSEEITVRWFRAPDGAKVITGPNVYTSSVWDDPDSPPTQKLGDSFPQTRKWDNGANTVGYRGIAPCGPASAFENGGRRGVTPVITTDARGTTPCCGTSRQLGQGGVGIGGFPRYLLSKSGRETLVKEVSSLAGIVKVGYGTVTLTKAANGSYPVPIIHRPDTFKGLVVSGRVFYSPHWNGTVEVGKTTHSAVRQTQPHQASAGTVAEVSSVHRIGP